MPVPRAPLPVLPQVSSTEIREAIARGEIDAVRERVPRAVLDYIEERGLYGARKG
jgi:nicotinate-nucleotide adenylyltransferase